MNASVYDKEIEAYGKLSHTERIQWLAGLAHELTIYARDTYEIGTEDVCDPKRLRGFNELSHRVIGQLRHEIDGTRGYPR